MVYINKPSDRLEIRPSGISSAAGGEQTFQISMGIVEVGRISGKSTGSRTVQKIRKIV